MMRKLLITAAAVALTASPAAATTFTVGIGSTFAIPGNNDFESDLNAVGLFNYTSLGSTLTLDSGPAKITFEYMGAESGAVDKFFAVSGPNTVTGTESGTPALPDNNFPLGDLLGALFYSSGGVFANDDLYFTTPTSPLKFGVGTGNFGIFLPRLPVGTLTYTSNVIYFGFDDQLTGNDDDNHDDFIIRATVSAAPEPETWAMMIGGFGLVGAAMRRRSGRRVVTA